MGFVDPTYFKDQFGVEGRVVRLTCGLLSPNKGIEYVLNALPEILAEFPDVVYIVLGATHPNELREHGEAYRLSLEILAEKNKVAKNVIFYNQFVDLENLKEFIGAADLYVTPYLTDAQQLIAFDLQFTPTPAGATGCLDQDGNLALNAWFDAPTGELSVTSRFTLEMLRADPFD